MEQSYIARLENVAKIHMLDNVAVHALKSIAVDIPRGKFNVVIGQSGSGKSTLLNLIGCIDVPTSGSIEVCGRNTMVMTDNELSDFRAKHIGFVFQTFNLMPVLSAYENVEYPLLINKTPVRDRHDMVMGTLEKVGLLDHRNKFPNELSGGQRQRVAIARALVKKPELILADEPTANLDHKISSEIIELMQNIQSSEKTTFVFSTHDSNLISNAEDIFMIMDGAIL
ncbi:MAG: ABC transporter ATP-binding protein [Elusimicrobiaceae bacterium]